MSLKDPIVRTALWLGYKKKCFYCKELIIFNKFQIDHVIPQNMEIEEAKDFYDLPDDFEKDSYYNLVPSCFPCNNQKRAKEFDKVSISFFLNIIKSKVTEIVKIKEIKGKGRYEINIEEIWYYAAFKEIDEQLVGLISEWCVQQTRFGRYVIKV